MAKRKKATSKKGRRAKKRTSSPKPPKTIGILHSASKSKHKKEIEALIGGLQMKGYTEGVNLTILGNDPYWSDDDPKKLADNARTLATAAGLDLIIAAGGTASVYALKKQQGNVGIYTPVVFTTFSEQNAPAPNMTGVNARTSEFDVARMELLYQKAPSSTARFGVLENPTRPNFDANKLQGWADSKFPRVITLDRQPVYKNPGETDQDIIDRIDQAFNSWKGKIEFAQVCADPIFNDFRKEVTRAAKKNGVRAVYQWKQFRDDGADPNDLVYGTLLMDAYEHAGEMAAQRLDQPFSIIPVYPLPQPGPSVKRKTAKRKRRQ